MPHCKKQIRRLGLSMLLLAPLRLPAQDVSAIQTQAPYSGFSLPRVGGTLRYSLTASEAIVFGYNGEPGSGANAFTNLSGNLAYLSHSEHNPFSAVYSGGYLIGTSNIPSYPFQNLALSQVVKTRNWNFIFADDIDYSPQTSDAGLSGIPGTGDLQIAPISIGGTPGLDILTDYSTRVTNIASATATRNLTGSTSVSVTGTYLLQRYLQSQSQGISNDEETGGVNVKHRVNERLSYGATYTFSNSTFQYGGSHGNYGYQTHTALGNFDWAIRRNVDFTVSAGPQLVVSAGGGLLTASSVNLSANASLSYTGRIYEDTLSYSRSINNGSGVVIGAQQDIVNLSAARELGRIYRVAAFLGYNHSASLPNLALPPYSSSAVVAGGQLSAQISRSFTGFGSYTLERQSVNGISPAGNAFNGLSQTIAFGVTYSPKAIFTRR
jgi:hypothetical protein